MSEHPDDIGLEARRCNALYAIATYRHYVADGNTRLLASRCTRQTAPEAVSMKKYGSGERQNVTTPSMSAPFTATAEKAAKMMAHAAFMATLYQIHRYATLLICDTGTSLT